MTQTEYERDLQEGYARGLEAGRADRDAALNQAAFNKHCALVNAAERDALAVQLQACQAALVDVMAEHTALVEAARPFLSGLDQVPTPDIGYVICVTAEEGDALRAAMPEPTDA